MSDHGAILRDGLRALTDREKETLRLLVAGHDAKSIARDLGLSVHTVNERLRDARRKLHVSSSREAARLLADSEEADPQILGDKQFGVSVTPHRVPDMHQAKRRPIRGHRLAWFSGGMLVMSLVIAAMIFSTFQGGAASPPPSAQATSVDPGRSAGLDPARAWVSLIDGQRWSESWCAAAGFFRSQVSEPQWASMIQAVRQPLGAVSNRTFLTVSKATSLPGVPDGEYEIIQFRTSFAQRQDATETVTLVREGGGWKAAGYFIR